MSSITERERSEGSTLWIADATPIIALAKIGHLHLLTDMASAVLFPPVVAQEVLACGPDDPAGKALRAGWGQMLAAQAVDPQIAALSLDPGETAVLNAALSLPGCIVAMDDGKGRRAAQAAGLNLIGTLGIIARARREGRVSAAAPLIRALLQNDFRLNEAIIRPVLTALSEKWP